MGGSRSASAFRQTLRYGAAQQQPSSSRRGAAAAISGRRGSRDQRPAV
jgi:hypothetical protein